MKTKVIALILAILCVSMMVVGCSKDCTEHIDENKDGKCDQCEAATCVAIHTDADGNKICDICNESTEVPCELHVDADADLICDVCKTAVDPICNPHKDTNADHLCDLCGGAIVVVTEQVAPKEEARVNMVVNTAPADAALGTFVQTDIVHDIPTSVVALGEYAYSHQKYFLFETVEGENTKYEVKDLVLNQVVYSLTKPTAINVSVNLENDYIFVSVIGDPLNDYIYLSYAGEVLFQKQANAMEAPTIQISDVRGYTMLTIEGKAFMIDPDTDAILLKNADPSTVIARPDFDVENEKFGVRNHQNTIYVYDLSKWINCAVSYDIPGYYEDVEWFMLENGNVILQGWVELTDDAVSYDCIDQDSKYDIVNVLIDPTAKTVSEIEFGYVIYNIVLASQNYYYEFTDAATNAVLAYPIVADRVDWNDSCTLLTDNALNVQYDLKNAFGGREFTAVGNGLFRVYDPVTDAYEILNAAGERVAMADNYVPSGYLNYRNGVWYDMSGKEITKEAWGVTLVENGFNQYADIPYAIFMLDGGAGNTSYWYYGGAGLVQIKLADITDVTVLESGFVVTHTVEGQDTFSYFNAGGSLVCELVGVPYNVDFNWITDDLCTMVCENPENGQYVTYVLKF